MTSLKQNKLQKFLNLTTLNMSALQNPVVLVGVLSAVATTYLFKHTFVAENSLFLNSFLSLMAGVAIGGVSTAFAKFGKQGASYLADQLDKKHTVRANFFNGNFYLNQIYHILKAVNTDLKNLPLEKHKEYLYQKQAKIMLLTRLPMLLQDTSLENFEVNHAPLVKALRENIGISKMLRGYEDTMKSRMQAPGLQKAVKEELLAQNINLVDLASDLVLLSKHKKQQKKWLTQEDLTTNASDEVFNVLAPICLNEQQLSTAQTQELCVLLGKLKEEMIEEPLKIIVEEAKSAHSLDFNVLSQFIKQNTQVNGVLAHNLQEKINILQTKAGYSTQSLAEISAATANQAPPSSVVPVAQDKPLFEAGIMAVLDSVEIDKMCENLSSQPQTPQIKSTLQSLGTELLLLEKNKHLLTTENAIELKLIVNKNLPALLHYLQSSEHLPAHIQPQVLSSIAQTLVFIKDSVEELKLTVGNNMLKDLDAIGKHMENKKKSLTAHKG